MHVASTVHLPNRGNCWDFLGKKQMLESNDMEKFMTVTSIKPALYQPKERKEINWIKQRLKKSWPDGYILLSDTEFKICSQVTSFFYYFSFINFTPFPLLFSYLSKKILVNDISNCQLNGPLALPAPIPDKNKKINLNFYFHTSLWCLERFYVGIKGLHRNFWGITKKCENKNLS